MSLTVNVDELIARIPEWKAGDRLLLRGTIYTARDAAHERLARMVEREKNCR